MDGSRPKSSSGEIVAKAAAKLLELEVPPVEGEFSEGVREGSVGDEDMVELI